MTRGFPKEYFGKRYSETHRRLYCGLQSLATRETPCGSSRLLHSVYQKDRAFSLPLIFPHHFALVDDIFLISSHRNFSTSKLPSTSEIENAAEATKSNDGQNEINENRREIISRSQKLSLERKNFFSGRGSTASSTKRNTGKVSTVIEPTVRRKPFQNFRHSVRSKKVNPNYSNDNLRRPATTTKRIFVNSLMNDGKNHPGPNLQQQQNIFGSPSSMSSFIKPGNEHGSYPVIAIQVARSIDLSKVILNVFATKGVRKMRERLSVVAQLQPNNTSTTATEAARFVAVFRFGSVVFFNVSPKEIDTLVEEIKNVSTGSLSSGKERRDRFCVHVQPPPLSSTRTGIGFDENNNDDVDVVTADYCIVPELNMKSVDVISNIMAQSVALDSYNDKVDKLLADFERINNKVTNEGNLTPVDRDKMFRAVAENNSIFLKLTKVGIKDRVDTAWNLSQYENVSDGMREEFDIDRRFEHIEFKLNLIQQNAKFFLEVLANQKSDSLEWIIIILILLECALMCVEMSGMGEPLFTYLGEFFPSRSSVP